MTLPHSNPTAPPPRRSSSLRVLLLVLFCTAALYAGALPVYLFFRIRAVAAGLAQGTAAAVPILQDLIGGVGMVDRSRRAAERAVERRTALDPALVEGVTRLATREQPAVRARQFPADSVLGHAVIHADSQISQLASAFTAASVLIGDRRWTEATTQLRLVDSLAAAADEQALVIASIGRVNMLARQQAMQRVTVGALRDTVLWLVLGLALLWLGLIAVQRKILLPLSALEAGLTRVADGDLNTQVPVDSADELGRLGTHFNEMTQVLLGRAEEQGRFTAAGQLLADVAHEVGNPLMAIAALAESGIGDTVARPDRPDEMQQILGQAQRATKLLRGLLRFVRPTQRHVSILNPNDVARAGIDVVSYRFGVDEIIVGGLLDPELPPVRCDAVGLEQVIVNLLSNAMDALRAIKPPRTLAVDSWIADGMVSIAVTDNGPGVAPELLDRLFRPFASTKGRRGAGLGLYISRQIAREAGGDLILDTRSGPGARFVITVPVAAAPEPPPPPPQVETAGPAMIQRLTGVRILLVDDEEAVRRPMAKFLKRRGAEVHEAGDGLQALALLDRQGVDVILADLRMPRMNGSELFAAIERNRPELAARVLFLSGDVSQLDEVGSARVPRERVLVKPVELAELERRVAEFIAASEPA